MPHLILSTIGTSLLSNHLMPDERRTHGRWLIERANASALAPEDAAFADALAQRAAATLADGDIAAIRRASAELNALYAFYENQPARHTQDIHVLVTSDTALGRRAAALVADHLRSLGFSVLDVVAPDGLSAAGTAAFEGGAKELIRWCAESLPGYKDGGYTIVFNLAAAFKALQGYLNTIGMFYADQILYLFEGSHEPLLIPRLPIAIDLDAIRAMALPLALMAEGNAALPLGQVAGMRRALYDSDGEDAMISGWGLLVWQQVCDEVLAGELLPFPLLRYSDSFRRDVQRANATERARLQATLATISARLMESGGNPARLKGTGGMQYDNYTGKQDGGRPIGHFRVSGGLRVSCIAEEGSLTLRHYGAHDYVNDRP